MHRSVRDVKEQSGSGNTFMSVQACVWLLLLCVFVNMGTKSSILVSHTVFCICACGLACVRVSVCMCGLL